MGAPATSYSAGVIAFVPAQKVNAMPAQAATGINQDFHKNDLLLGAAAGASSRMACSTRLLKNSG